MAMKPIAIVIIVAALAVATVASTAKTVTTEGNTNERMVAGVAGPVAAANTSQHKMKTEVKKTKAKEKVTAAKPAPVTD